MRHSYVFHSGLLVEEVDKAPHVAPEHVSVVRLLDPPQRLLSRSNLSDTFVQAGAIHIERDAPKASYPTAWLLNHAWQRTRKARRRRKSARRRERERERERERQRERDRERDVAEFSQQ